MSQPMRCYERLVDALRELVERCDGAEGVRADGSNIDTLAARMLLEEVEPSKPKEAA